MVSIHLLRSISPDTTYFVQFNRIRENAERNLEFSFVTAKPLTNINDNYFVSNKRKQRDFFVINNNSLYLLGDFHDGDKIVITDLRGKIIANKKITSESFKCLI